MKSITSALAALAILAVPCAGQAADSVSFRIGFSGQVDCMEPLEVSNIPLSIKGTGTLNVDGTGVIDFTETAFYVLTTRIHIDGRLGGPPQPAPGGEAQISVAGDNGLLVNWLLPTTSYLVSIAVAGDSCSATLETKLRPGQTRYQLFDGKQYHYCTKPSVQKSSCEVR